MRRETDDHDAPIVMQFYHSHALPYLMVKWQAEIAQRYKDVPRSLREAELASKLAALGETRGDPAWQVFRAYLDKLEDALASVVRRHSPSFWIHLHRRLRPMLADNGESKTDDTTVTLVRRIAELAYAKHGDLARTDDLGPILQTRLESFLGGAWYEGTAHALRSKLKAKKLYQIIKWSKQVVMTDFRVDDLLDVFGIEGLVECFSYELPLDFEVGKPSVFEKRKQFLIKKLDQAKSLAERIRLELKGSNFDVSWAEEIDWRVVSPFVEFAWEIDEMFFDERGLPRVLQAEELLNHLTDGKMPAQRLVRYVREFRGVKPAGRWY